MIVQSPTHPHTILHVHVSISQLHSNTQVVEIDSLCSRLTTLRYGLLNSFIIVKSPSHNNCDISLS